MNTNYRHLSNAKLAKRKRSQMQSSNDLRNCAVKNQMETFRAIEVHIWRLKKHLNIEINHEGLARYIASILDNVSVTEVTDRIAAMQKYCAQLHILNKQPKVQQRSEAWFELRKNRLTASDTAQALGLSKYSKQAQLVQKKAFPDRNQNFDSMAVPALRHGVIYEAMALRCYQQRHDGISVHEFGLIPHPSLSCYGASPDGISELGIMIEIKCPLKRVIDGTIPEQYYIQMQGQMAVCGLNECDYIECDIQEISCCYDYQGAVEETCVHDHGAVIQMNDKLEYSPPELTPAAVLEWVANAPADATKFFWKLRKIDIQRVYFDKTKWDKYEVGIVDFWKQVEEARKPVKYAFIEDDDDT